MKKTTNNFMINDYYEIGIKIRKERDDYRASSDLWKLRERARTLKTPKAQDKAWSKFYAAFKAKFPEGSKVWIDAGLNFNTLEAGGYATYKPMLVTVHWNGGRDIRFAGLDYDCLEIYYDPCGHDNLMALELAQLNNR